MAADFLRKLGRHLDYNINIMDRRWGHHREPRTVRVSAVSTRAPSACWRRGPTLSK
jgi:hypothetical protein